MEATEPKTEGELVDSLLAPQVTDDEDTDAPDLEEDQTEDEPKTVDEDPDQDEPGEDDDAEEVDAAPEQPDTYTVKVDGEDVQVTLEELQRSYSGQRYIQKGMNENAEVKKQAQATLQSLQQQQEQFQQFVQFAEQGGLVRPTPPSTEMLQSDPIGYMEAKAAYDVQEAEYNGAVQAYQQNQQFIAQQQQEAFQAHLAEQRRALEAAIPEWSDPEKGPVLKGQIRDIGVNEYGFSEEEISQISDSRAVRVLRDAMRYHEVMKKAGKAAEKAANARPVAKAGAKPKTDPKRAAERKKLDRLRKTGSDEAAIDLLFNG